MNPFNPPPFPFARPRGNFPLLPDPQFMGSTFRHPRHLHRGGPPVPMWEIPHRPPHPGPLCPQRQRSPFMNGYGNPFQTNYGPNCQIRPSIQPDFGTSISTGFSKHPQQFDSNTEFTNPFCGPLIKIPRKYVMEFNEVLRQLFNCKDPAESTSGRVNQKLKKVISFLTDGGYWTVIEKIHLMSDMINRADQLPKEVIFRVLWVILHVLRISRLDQHWYWISAIEQGFLAQLSSVIINVGKACWEWNDPETAELIAIRQSLKIHLPKPTIKAIDTDLDQVTRMQWGKLVFRSPKKVMEDFYPTTPLNRGNPIALIISSARPPPVKAVKVPKITSMPLKTQNVLIKTNKSVPVEEIPNPENVKKNVSVKAYHHWPKKWMSPAGFTKDIRTGLNGLIQVITDPDSSISIHRRLQFATEAIPDSPYAELLTIQFLAVLLHKFEKMHIKDAVLFLWIIAQVLSQPQFKSISWVKDQMSSFLNHLGSIMEGTIQLCLATNNTAKMRELVSIRQSLKNVPLDFLENLDGNVDQTSKLDWNKLVKTKPIKTMDFYYPPQSKTATKDPVRSESLLSIYQSINESLKVKQAGVSANEPVPSTPIPMIPIVPEQSSVPRQRGYMYEDFPSSPEISEEEPPRPLSPLQSMGLCMEQMAVFNTSKLNSISSKSKLQKKSNANEIRVGTKRNVALSQRNSTTAVFLRHNSINHPNKLSQTDKSQKEADKVPEVINLEDPIPISEPSVNIHTKSNPILKVSKSSCKHEWRKPSMSSGTFKTDEFVVIHRLLKVKSSIPLNRRLKSSIKSINDSTLEESDIVKFLSSLLFKIKNLHFNQEVLLLWVISHVVSRRLRNAAWSTNELDEFLNHLGAVLENTIQKCMVLRKNSNKIDELVAIRQRLKRLPKRFLKNLDGNISPETFTNLETSSMDWTTTIRSIKMETIDFFYPPVTATTAKNPKKSKGLRYTSKSSIKDSMTLSTFSIYERRRRRRKAKRLSPRIPIEIPETVFLEPPPLEISDSETVFLEPPPPSDLTQSEPIEPEQVIMFSRSIFNTPSISANSSPAEIFEKETDRASGSGTAIEASQDKPSSKSKSSARRARKAVLKATRYSSKTSDKPSLENARQEEVNEPELPDLETPVPDSNSEIEIILADGSESAEFIADCYLSETFQECDVVHDDNKTKLKFVHNSRLSKQNFGTGTKEEQCLELLKLADLLSTFDN